MEIEIQNNSSPLHSIGFVSSMPIEIWLLKVNTEQHKQNMPQFSTRCFIFFSYFFLRAGSCLSRTRLYMPKFVRHDPFDSVVYQYWTGVLECSCTARACHLLSNGWNVVAVFHFWLFLSCRKYVPVVIRAERPTKHRRAIVLRNWKLIYIWMRYKWFTIFAFIRRMFVIILKLVDNY